MTQNGDNLMFDNSRYLKTKAETASPLRLELIVNVGHAFMSATAIMESTRFWR